MGSWTILSFYVANPYERVEQLESWFLPSDDVGVNSDGVIGFRTDRSYPHYYSLPPDATTPDESTVDETTDDESTDSLEELFASDTGFDPGKARIYSNDIVVFGPIMDTVLESGEYGAVIGVSNTSDGAGGTVYEKDENGMVSIAGTVDDNTSGDMGTVMREECEAKFGFKPFVWIESITD